MSEITASEKEESSDTVLLTSEDTSEIAGDVEFSEVKETELVGEATLELDEMQNEDEPALESASVDVTVESKDSENESSSSAETEDQVEQESEEPSEEANLIDGSNDNDPDEESENSDEEELDEETVTCALLGLEQAKVMPLTLSMSLISDPFLCR